MDLFAILTVLIFFSAILIGLAVVCWTIIKLVGAGTHRAATAEEARLIQEMHRGLIKMEERVEALETLLFDRDSGARR